MLVYRVWYLSLSAGRVQWFFIGVYDSRRRATDAIAQLRQKPGFCQRPEKFHMVRMPCLHLPKLINCTFWTEGFVPYTYPVRRP